MKIETFRHTKVKPNGTFENKLGAVITEGGIRMSPDRGGCDLKGCRCSEGHWITIVKPRTAKGVVEGTRVKFDNKAEMDEFLRTKELSMV